MQEHEKSIIKTGEINKNQEHAHGHEHAQIHSHEHDHSNEYGQDQSHKQGHEHSQTQGHEQGHEHSQSQSHEHGHEHAHGHVHPNSKAVSNRLAKAIGHLEAVKRMVDRGEDCSQILIQLAAVRSAINNAGKVILMDHLNHCIVDAVEDGNLEKIEEFSEAIQKFVK